MNSIQGRQLITGCRQVGRQVVASGKRRQRKGETEGFYIGFWGPYMSRCAATIAESMTHAPPPLHNYCVVIT